MNTLCSVCTIHYVRMYEMYVWKICANVRTPQCMYTYICMYIYMYCMHMRKYINVLYCVYIQNVHGAICTVCVYTHVHTYIQYVDGAICTCEPCLFCRRHLTQQMQSRPGEVEVKLLLFAIQKTATFEKSLAQKYTCATSSYIKSVSLHPS